MSPFPFDEHDDDEDEVDGVDDGDLSVIDLLGPCLLTGARFMGTCRVVPFPLSRSLFLSPFPFPLSFPFHFALPAALWQVPGLWALVPFPPHVPFLVPIYSVV